MKAYLFLSLVFCTFSLACLAGNGMPSPADRFDRIPVEQMLRDTVPETNSAEDKKAGEKKEEGIKEVPKARKQVKPLAVDRVPVINTPEVKSIIKPIIKPVIKPVVKPVIKPAIRIH